MAPVAKNGSVVLLQIRMSIALLLPNVKDPAVLLPKRKDIAALMSDERDIVAPVPNGKDTAARLQAQDCGRVPLQATRISGQMVMSR